MKTAAAFSKVEALKFPPEQKAADLLAVEEPLEIRLGFHANGNLAHRPISITMRTPGHDAELAAGFLFTEGIISRADQITEIKHCGKPDSPGFQNTIRVDLIGNTPVDLRKLERHFYTTSSCGVCGKSSIEALETGARKVQSSFKFPAALISALPETLRAAQSVFERTGGLHASALFDAAGNLLIAREDVGRHNALDKVIGAKFLAGEIPPANSLLLVSGRASFELAQKAVMAGIPILAAVGSPSSLAVELAKEFNLTLLGFVRDGRFNIYCGAERIIF